MLEPLPMDMRELKALEIAARCRINFKDGFWLVPSQSSDKTYRVTIDPPACGCEDFALRAKPCKHILAVKLTCERDHGGRAPEIIVDKVPRKRTYRQVWDAYNRAQCTEKNRLQVLLSELCRDVPQLPSPARGQKRIPTPDVVFAMVFKVYTCLPSRRFTCDLEDAQAKGHVGTMVHFNSLCRHFEMPEMTPILQSLIVRSSMPLRAVETTFAPDSSGFSVSRFIKWQDEKYGVQRSGKDWVKAHIMTGVRTNIITAAEIHGRDANDSPIMPSLLQTTADNFKVREIMADKGYSSTANIEAIHAAGAVPFVAFKSNANGAAGGLWEKAFLFYMLNREDFLKRYHQRSNVESTFSMVKAKFRDHVRSRTDVSMANEVYCKLLAHNICVLIQSQCELGIEPVFWQDEAMDGPRDVLPMLRPG